MSEKPVVYERIDEQIKNEEKFSQEQREAFREFFLEYYKEISFKNEDIRLDRFFAKNFRTINKTEVTFDRSDTILYGQNSKGKTSFVKALLYNIAGLPENASTYDMTRLVKTGKQTSNTVGYWTIDDSPHTLERRLRQEGQGSPLSGDQEPYLSEGHTTEASISGKFTDPSEVLETFGLLDLKQRGHDPFEILSLFFLMSEDFTRFLGEKHSELMDLLFGINITTVVSAAENKIEDLELSDSENASIQKLRQYQSKKQTIETELSETQIVQENVLDNLKERKNELVYIKDRLQGENKLDRLRNRKNELQGRRADYKVKKSEVVEDLASVRRTVERYEDTELLDDVEGMVEELQNFMTVPNRCPICTNPVDTNQREKLIHNAVCPLCSKDMPQDRYHEEIEYEQSETGNNTRDDQYSEDLESLRQRQSELKRKEERLEARIQNVDQELEEISKKIDESDLSNLAEEQDRLQREVRELQDKAVELDVQIDSLEAQLTTIELEIRANKHLKEIGQEKANRRKAFSRYKTIVEKARVKQRQKIKQQLVEEIRDLFQYFTHGTLEKAHSVEFKSGGSYHFVIQTSERELDSSVADESTAEINLHSLLFHTAVLKRLSKSINSPPLRVFAIDSPFSNEVDEQNAQDIVDFLVSLPEILPEYQILLASAETDSFEPSDYSENYQLIRFN